MLNIQEKKDGVTIECYVSPRGSKCQIKGEREGMLAVALRSPPIEGRANEELIELLADTFSIPKSHITILRGETSRKKLIFLRGVNKEVVIRLSS